MRKFLLTVLLSSFALTAAAVNTDITITGNGTLRQTSSPDDEVLVVAVDLNGVAATSSFGSGNINGSGNLTDDANGTLTTRGTFQVVFSPGNVVYGYITVPNSLLFDVDQVNMVLSFHGAIANITRGTGVFAGATGQFPNMSGTLTVVSADDVNHSGTFSFQFTGSG